jgi:nucleoside-diphosphate-sugar epimerase
VRVLLAGSSGAIGLPLTRQLVERGHDVVALHRAARNDEPLRALGARPVRVDVLDREALLASLDGYRCDAVISQLTALQRLPVMHRDMRATNRLRTAGTANLLAAADRVGAGRFVTQSMVFGYGYRDHGDRVLTEDDPFAPVGHGRFEEHLAAMRSNEAQVLGARDLDGVALRFGLFYGPGPAGDAMVEGLRRRRLPVIGGGGVLPVVYIDDAATATVAALEHGARGRAYNVADDEPVSFSTLLSSAADALGAPAPPVLPAALLRLVPYGGAVMRGGLRVSTERAKAELGWRPAVPTYRDGVARLAASYPTAQT